MFWNPSQNQKSNKTKRNKQTKKNYFEKQREVQIIKRSQKIMKDKMLKIRLEMKNLRIII